MGGSKSQIVYYLVLTVSNLRGKVKGKIRAGIYAATPGSTKKRPNNRWGLINLVARSRLEFPEIHGLTNCF